MLLNAYLHTETYAGAINFEVECSETAPEAKNQVEGWFFLNVVIRQGASILQLLASEDKTLLVRGNTLLVLDFCLYILNGIWWLYFQGDGLPCQGLYKDLHATTQTQHQM